MNAVRKDMIIMLEARCISSYLASQTEIIDSTPLDIKKRLHSCAGVFLNQ
jgi:hypothetical protein